MKVAIISDIHGNLPALEAVAEDIDKWQPDAVIVDGDVVNRGPSSLECWQFVRERANWQIVLGNHEEYVLKHTQPRAENGRLFEINRLSYWTYQQLNGQAAELGKLPVGLSLYTPGNNEVRVRHASMRGTRDGIYPFTTDEEMRDQIAPPPDVFVTAHIHEPFIREVDKTLVVNVGSVGSPCDGDNRASYGQVVWQNGRFQANIIRMPYDVARAEQDFYTSGYLTESGIVSWLIYHEWRTAKMILPSWIATYQEDVLQGEIELETAVRRYLGELGLEIRY